MRLTTMFSAVACASLMVVAAFAPTASASPPTSSTAVPVSGKSKPRPQPKSKADRGSLATVRNQNGPGSANQAAMDAAAAQAHRTKRPIVVTALTNETSTVVAQPHGGFSVESHTVPVRARQNGGWVPIDTTLHRVSGGSYQAAVLPYVTVTFSGGGSGPFAQISGAGSTLALTWPGKLPVPSVSGANASYRSVLPGVDLVVTALASGGFSEVLVVGSAAAARNPALAKLVLGVSGHGIQLASTKDGGLAATDATGHVSFSAAAPRMWDSSTAAPSELAANGPLAKTAQSLHAQRAQPGLGRTSSTAGPASGSLIAPVTTTASRDRITLVPDTAILTSPTAKFPVYIDPTFNWWPASGSRQAYDEVQSSCPSASHYNSTDTAYNTEGVGYNPWGDCLGSAGYAYTYYQVSMPSQLWHASYINNAVIKATEMYTASCTVAGTVALSWTGLINPGTAWSNMPGTVGQPLDSHSIPPNTTNNNTNCNTSYSDSLSEGMGVSFNVISAMRTAATAPSAWQNFTFRLWEPNPASDGTTWKRFAKDLYLSAQFNDTPNVPTSEDARTGGDDAGCTTSVNGPYGTLGHAASVTGPQLWATYKDRDGDQLQGTIRYWNQTVAGSGTPTYNTLTTTSTNISSGSQGVAQVPSSFVSGLANGTVIGWQAEASDGAPSYANPASAWSAPCYFAVYPQNPDAPTVTAPAAANGTGGCATLTNITSGCSATVTLTAATTGGQATKMVWGLDQAPPTTSPPTSQVATFTGGPVQGPVARWKLADGTGTTATDASGYGNSAVLAGNASFNSDHGGALVLDGTSGEAHTSGPVVNTTAGFTVSAWVNLADTSSVHTAVAQAAGTSSGFFLQYSPADNKWAFSRTNTDTANATGIRALSTTAPTLNTWTHLTGAYDVSTGAMTLYVNGVQAGTATDTTPFAATGATLIGRSQYNAAPADYWHGEISDVQVYNRTLSAADVTSLYGSGNAAPAAGRWKLADGSGTTAADSSGGNHPATLTGSATWATDHGGSLSFNGTGGEAATAGPVLNTAGSFSVSAWVYLTNSTNWNTAVVQEGTTAGGFYLQYDGGSKKWAFSRAATDTTSPTVYRAESASAPQLNTWTHLAGVYDATSGAMTLYVNGIRAGTATDTTPMASNGPLAIGHGYSNGAVGAYWNGKIADVQAYAQALMPAEVGTIYATATVNISVPSSGPHLFKAYSADAAGNVSGNTQQGFLAAGDQWANPFPSLSAAFDNTMISDDSKPTAADADGQGYSLSAQSLQSSGWRPGGTVNVDGATLSLPQFGTGQPDNVLAAGQTINLPTGTHGSALVFLATSVNANVLDPGAQQNDYTAPYVSPGSVVTGWGCNTTDPSIGYATPINTVGCATAQGTISYAANGSTAPPAQSYYLHVPGWDYTPFVSVLAVNQNSPTGRTGLGVFLYAFAVPINPSYTVSSVTLPDVSRFLLPGGGTPGLHILSIGVRNTTTTTPVQASPTNPSATPVMTPSGQAWTGAWASPSEGAYAPVSGNWGNQTFRIAVTPTISGSAVRVRLAQQYLSDVGNPVKLSHVTIAPQSSGAAAASSPVNLTFGGANSVTVPEGGDVYSDPLNFTVTAQNKLLVSFSLADTSDYYLPEHTWSSADEWVTAAGSGDHSADTAATAFTGSGTQHLLATNLLTNLDVSTANKATVAVLGDSLIGAGGYGTPSTTATRPDAALATSGVAANYGVIGEGYETEQIAAVGYTTLSLIDHDILAQPGIGTTVLDQGLQDLLAGTSKTDLESGITALTTILNGHGITVILGTATPCYGYSSCTTAVDQNRSDLNNDIVGTLGWSSCSIAMTTPCVEYADFAAAVGTLDATSNEYKLIPTADVGDHVNLTSAGSTAVVGQIQSNQLYPNNPVVS